MSDIICELNNVNFTYPNTDKGVKDINLYVKKGRCVGLLGESGCGKSTLAKCISGQVKGVEGKIVCGKIGYVFQDAYSSLNPAKKVGWLLKEVKQSVFVRLHQVRIQARRQSIYRDWIKERMLLQFSVSALPIIHWDSVPIHSYQVPSLR